MNSFRDIKVKIYFPVPNDIFDSRREWVSQSIPGDTSKKEVPFYRINIDANKFDKFVMSMPSYISVLDQNGNVFDPKLSELIELKKQSSNRVLYPFFNLYNDDGTIDVSSWGPKVFNNDNENFERILRKVVPDLYDELIFKRVQEPSFKVPFGGIMCIMVETDELHAPHIITDLMLSTKKAKINMKIFVDNLPPLVELVTMMLSAKKVGESVCGDLTLEPLKTDKDGNITATFVQSNKRKQAFGANIPKGGFGQRKIEGGFNTPY